MIGFFVSARTHIVFQEALNRNDEKVRFDFFGAQQDVASQQKSINYILLNGLPNKKKRFTR